MTDATTPLRCLVVTPEAQVTDAQVAQVILPAHDGLMGVLPGHAPMLCNLGAGLLRYREDGGGEQVLFIDGGFGHIHKNEVTILTCQAIAKPDVNLADAREELTSAEALPTTSLQQHQTRTAAIHRAKQLIALAES